MRCHWPEIEGFGKWRLRKLSKMNTVTSQPAPPQATGACVCWGPKQFSFRCWICKSEIRAWEVPLPRFQGSTLPFLKWIRGTGRGGSPYILINVLCNESSALTTPSRPAWSFPESLPFNILHQRLQLQHWNFGKSCSKKSHRKRSVQEQECLVRLQRNFKYLQKSSSFQE